MSEIRGDRLTPLFQASEESILLPFQLVTVQPISFTAWWFMPDAVLWWQRRKYGQWRFLTMIPSSGTVTVPYS